MKNDDQTPAGKIVRRAVREGRAYVPGTTLEQARRELGVDRIVKLSSNENPLGTSPRALAALAHLDALNVYVDNQYLELREKLAGKLGVGVENVTVGHGSNELLELMFETFVDSGERVIMAKPTFSLFPQNAHLREADSVEIPLKDGVHDLDAMASAIDHNTKLILICDPNNPTATCVQPADMQRFLKRLPEDVLLAFDQAYREFMPDGVDGVALAMQRPNTLVYRTMSKAHGLASMRIGYVVGQADAIGYMQRVRLPFNVTRASLVAALAALDDDDFVRRSVQTNAEQRTRLHGDFARLGLFAYPSAANFIAVQVPVEANRAYTDLLKLGIAVRSGDALGLPHFLRITVGTAAENDALVAALEKQLPAWKEPQPAGAAR
ncbi:MAG: histidinol-phosphate transaminase [Candidatus Eremiobacteraeota bacterium]|nr:histidinol-phosphate transaminase [Candidatus Eremiobacteraeota bacterium]